MPLTKESKCTKCGKRFSWVINRPGDSYWNRWISDLNDTLSAWWQSHNLCWDHTFEELPQKFVPLFKTIRYDEEDHAGSDSQGKT